MLATSLDYYRREHKQFWWEHFERLHTRSRTGPIRATSSSSSPPRSSRTGRCPTAGRRSGGGSLRLVGDWTPGSKAGVGRQVVYATPHRPGRSAPTAHRMAPAGSDSVEVDTEDPRVVMLLPRAGSLRTHSTTFRSPWSQEGRRHRQASTTPSRRSHAGRDRARAPASPCSTLAGRRRAHRDGALPGRRLGNRERRCSALLDMDDSYVAIQGPPGTGKTFTGSQVIKDLVEKHGWRIGVVAQSHAVVENMLAGIVKAGSTRHWSARTSPRATPVVDGAAEGCSASSSTSTPDWMRFRRNRLGLRQRQHGSSAQPRPPRHRRGRPVLAGHHHRVLGRRQAAAPPRRPQQLPQVSQGTHAEPVDESALGWLMDGARHDPRSRGYFLDRVLSHAPGPVRAGLGAVLRRPFELRRLRPRAPRRRRAWFARGSWTTQAAGPKRQ